MPFGLQPTHLIVLFVVCLICITPVLIAGGVAFYIVASRSSKNQ